MSCLCVTASFTAVNEAVTKVAPSLGCELVAARIRCIHLWTDNICEGFTAVNQPSLCPRLTNVCHSVRLAVIRRYRP